MMLVASFQARSPTTGRSLSPVPMMPQSGASCIPGVISRDARRSLAAPPCGRGSARRSGTYAPGWTSASSRNPTSFASSCLPIAGVMVPRRGRPTSVHQKVVVLPYR